MTDEELKAKELDEAEAKAKADANTGKSVSEEDHRKAIADVVAEREEQKRKYRETRDKLKEIEDRLAKVPSSDTVDKLIKEKKDLEDYKKKAEEDAEKKKLADASELEKAQFQLKKVEDAYAATLKAKEEELGGSLKKLQDEFEKKATKVKRLLDFKKESEILLAAEEFGAYRPKQIVTMLKDEFELDEETESFFYSVLTDRGKKEKELSIRDRVKAFLEDPINDNLKRADVKGGSGTQSGARVTTTTDDGAKKFMRKEADILKEEAEERGMTTEEWAKIKKRTEELRKSKV